MAGKTSLQQTLAETRRGPRRKKRLSPELFLAASAFFLLLVLVFILFVPVELKARYEGPIQQYGEIDDAALRENDDLKHRIAALEHSLQEANAANAQPVVVPQLPTTTESELEAYRRAERVERVAKERARLVSQQTAQALGQISAQMDDAAEQLAGVAAQITQQLEQLQQAVAGSRQAVRDAAGMVESLNAEIEE